MKEQTKLIRTQATRSNNREHSVPLYLTSSFIFDNAEQGRAVFAGEEEANIYSRYSNPNTAEFITKVCEMEGAEDGLAFSSGMAAVFASLAGFLKSGDHVIACRSVFGSTIQLLSQLLPRWGITTTYVDTLQPGAVSYTHLRAHETGRNLVCRLLLEKKKKKNHMKKKKKKNKQTTNKEYHIYVLK